MFSWFGTLVKISKNQLACLEADREIIIRRQSLCLRSAIQEEPYLEDTVLPSVQRLLTALFSLENALNQLRLFCQAREHWHKPRVVNNWGAPDAEGTYLIEELLGSVVKLLEALPQINLEVCILRVRVVYRLLQRGEVNINKLLVEAVQVRGDLIDIGETQV